MEKETVRVQMDADVAKKASQVFKKYDLTTQEAVEMLYEKFVLTGQLPFEFKA